ncbi:MAG: squalene synthase HpnC [Burkholderiales bacterium]
MAVGHYENFPVATRLVPARLRPAVVALYRFARSADDIADEGDAAPAQRLAALAAYDAALDEIARGGTPAQPPFPALAEAVRAHALPLGLLNDLVSAFRQDVTVGRYSTYGDLLDYCRRSANPVGRLLLVLYRADSPANVAASDAICTGLQLVNFWQDVAIDWRKDRVYLPQEDLDRFGVPIAAIAAGRADDAWRALLAFEVQRARALLEAGRPLAAALPWRLGLELAAVIAGGLRICARIDAVGGDVFARRPTLRTRDWWAVAYHALFMRRTARRAPTPR